MMSRLLILYGGETGNSQDVARIVFRESRKRGIPVKAMSIGDYPMADLINERLVLFVCSTTGQGNEPLALKKFWNLIMRKTLPNDTLSHLNAAVIGLGDSSYIKYNVVGKKLFKRLQTLGSKMFLDLALGDDQHDLGLWAAVDPWLANFWPKLQDIIPLAVDTDLERLPQPCYRVHTITSCNGSDGMTNGMIKDQIKVTSNIYEGVKLCSVINNQRVTPQSHFQDVRFIQLSLDNQPSLDYQPGDVAMILPENPVDEVDEFICLLGLDPEKQFYLEKVVNDFLEDNGYDSLPGPIDVRTLVTKYMDIHSVPKRSFFDLLWRFSDDDLEQSKLREFASKDGQQDLYTYCHQPKRNILEVLKDFPNTRIKIPFEYLFDLIPSIRPRAFSIASSLKRHPNELHLLVAVVKHRTKLRKPRLGLCSNYLAQVKTGDRVRLWTRKGEFNLPINGPMIMIGPGTGVAPFRSIIQQRICDGIYSNTLFFGCRYSNADFYFQDEWKDYESKGFLKLFTAFSRDNPDKKWYVQDEIWQNKATIGESIFSKGAIVLIAGSSNQMPEDIRKCIKNILLSHDPKVNPEQAEKIIYKLESSRRIQYECWS